MWGIFLLFLISVSGISQYDNGCVNKRLEFPACDSCLDGRFEAPECVTFVNSRRQAAQSPPIMYRNGFLVFIGIFGAVFSALLVVVLILVILFQLYLYLTYEERDYARTADWKQVRFSQQYSHVRLDGKSGSAEVSADDMENEGAQAEEGFSPQEISSIRSNRNLEIFDWNAYEIVDTLQENSDRKVIVYKMKWNLHNNSIVVVKLFPYDFKREIRISVFSCNNIAHCSGLTIAPSSYLGVVMEHFENGSLVDHIGSMPPKSRLGERVKILHNVLQGLEYLHDRSFIIRHLMPSNVFVTKERVAKISLYSLDSIFFNPPMGVHKAPEVVLNESVDIRSDIYSFAFLVHFILTGRINPFKGKAHSMKNFKLKLAADPNFRPRLKKENYHEKAQFLIDIMEKCWAYSPRKRPTASGLRAQFADALKGFVVSNFFQSVGKEEEEGQEDVFVLKSESEDEEEDEEEEDFDVEVSAVAAAAGKAPPPPPPPSRKPKIGDTKKLVIGKEFDPNSEVVLGDILHEEEEYGEEGNYEAAEHHEEVEEDVRTPDQVVVEEKDEAFEELDKNEQQEVLDFDERSRRKQEYRKTLRERIEREKVDSKFKEFEDAKAQAVTEAKKRPFSVRLAQGVKGIFNKVKSPDKKKKKKIQSKVYALGVDKVFSYKTNRNLNCVDPSEIEIVSTLSKEETCEVFLAKYQRKEYAYKVFYNVVDENSEQVPEINLFTHNNVLRNFGVCWDEEKESLGILLEYCSTGTLESLINSSTTSLLVFDKVKLLKGVLTSLSYLHSVGVVHGDLRKSDIFLSKSFLPKTSIYTRERIFGGKMPSHYRPPEMVDNELPIEDFDPSVDIYSFGMIIHEVITETGNPFGMSDADVEAKLGGDPDFRPTVDESLYEGMEWLLEIIKNCWNTNPSKRPKFKKLNQVLSEKLKTLMFSSFVGKIKNGKKSKASDPDVVDNIMEPSGQEEEEQGEYFGEYNEDEGEYYGEEDH